LVLFLGKKKEKNKEFVLNKMGPKGGGKSPRRRKGGSSRGKKKREDLGRGPHREKKPKKKKTWTAIERKKVAEGGIRGVRRRGTYYENLVYGRREI